MACLSTRPYQRLVDDISRQAGNLAVEVLTDVDMGESTSGIKRQRLLERASGDYVCYVDDDDEVSHDYVRSVVSATELKPDVVTFDMRVDIDRRRRESWSLRLGPDMRWRGVMSANHLCAWRRDIATRVAWHPLLGYGDDQMWYKPLMMSGLVKREIHVPRTLYSYVYSSSSTANQKKDVIARSRGVIGNGMRVYRDQHGELLIGCGPLDDESIEVRDRHNVVSFKLLSELSHLGTVKLV